ncbi:hypothetical protein R3P38DRAFT_3133388 [Favolaschia claudopus]|uniref:F-box domain-containing protein n=1 Tax=Favolaschia claudopus TaxID=2862362 RepID=A0AAV9Z8K8_9AGAR
MVPDLPQELIDAIVDEVPDSSLPAWSLTVLTATSFVVSSQRRLFRWMSLEDGIAKYVKAARFLAASPHLGRYFRNLALNLGKVPADFAELRVIVAALSELECVTIRGDPDGMAPGRYLTQNSCLIELISLPTLRCLALHVIDLPSSVVLRALSSLEEVILHCVTFVDEEEEQLEGEGRTIAPGNVWHLKVRSWDTPTLAFILHPRHNVLLQNLGRFTVVFPPVEELLQPHFIQFYLWHVPRSNTPPTYLPTLPNLYVLELLIDVELTKSPPDFISIISAGIMISATHNLEVLIIAILDRPDGPHRPDCQLWTARNSTDWAPLDSALMDMAQEHLCEVHFSLRSFANSDRGRFSFDAFAGFVGAHMPRVIAAGLVGMDYSPHFTHPMWSFVG